MSPTKSSDNNFDGVKISQISDSEWEIDIRECHGLGVKESSAFSFPENPYSSSEQTAVTGIGSVRGIVANTIEQVIDSVGGFSSVGSNMIDRGRTKPTHWNSIKYKPKASCTNA